MEEEDDAIFLYNIAEDISEQVLITYKTRAHAQLFVTLLPQAVSQTFRHI